MLGPACWYLCCIAIVFVCLVSLMLTYSDYGVSFSCSKTIDIPIIDREEYEKDKSFQIVISEPKLVHTDSLSHIPDLRDVKDMEMKKIIEAGKPTLGEFRLFASLAGNRML